MSKRVTIIINDDLMGKLRSLQVNMMKKENSSYSFSKIINECVRKGLK